MLPSSRPRSGSWGGGAPRTPPPPRHERSWSTATYPPSSSSERGGDAVLTEEMAARLEGELRADEEEERITGARMLEREVAAAKQTERKMLESLIHQTKELEQAKMALEEAKLELATLRRGAAAGPAQAQWSVMDLMFGGVDEEMNGLRGKLRTALLAEEKSRKAANDLTAALSAVTMEAKQVKAWLSDAQAELETTTTEVGRLERLLHTTEVELWSATEQLDGLTSEWKEAAAAWRAREKILLGRVRAAEGEADGVRHENAKLGELQRAVDDENGGLRRALEQAVEEANEANESLEFASSENSKLSAAIAEKEGALKTLRQENEALKASEAAARGRANDLDDQLAAATKKVADAAAGDNSSESPSEKWRGEIHGKLSAALLDSGRVMASRKDRMFASLSNIAELRSAAAAAALDDYEFDHLDCGRRYGDHREPAMKYGKRRSVLRKFGDLFRWRSLHKSSSLGPVMHH